MKTPIVTETRRAGQAGTAHRSQRDLVARSLVAVPERSGRGRGAWDERTRTESRVA